MPRKKTFAQRASDLPDVQPFPRIAYNSFAYAGDDDALRALRAIPGVPDLFRWIYKHLLDDFYRLNNNYNHLAADDRSYPTLHRLLERCCAVLDVAVPELYIGYSPTYNAYTSGVEKPFIVLHSSLIESFSPAEVCYIIGHELGHIKAKHVLYSSVARFIIEYMPLLQSLIPVNVGIIQMPLLLALFEWTRRAEMSCDRAGLLCVQDADVALSAQARLTGRLSNLPEEFDIERAVKQYHDAEDSENVLAKVLLMFSSFNMTHPYGVARLYRMRQFLHGEKYQKILAGEYEREK